MSCLFYGLGGLFRSHEADQDTRKHTRAKWRRWRISEDLRDILQCGAGWEELSMVSPDLGVLYSRQSRPRRRRPRGRRRRQRRRAP